MTTGENTADVAKQEEDKETTEGGSAAATGQLDLLGVLVLVFATAVGGGI